MKKSTLTRLITFSAAAFMLSIAAAYVSGVRASSLEKMMLVSNENALYELIESTTRMKDDISSLKYGTTGISLAETATRIWGDSRAAESSIAHLPLSESHLLEYEKLLNQAGDFSLTLLKQSADGKPVTREQLNTLESIADATDSLNSKLISAKSLIDCGDIGFDGLGSAIAGLDLSNVGELIYDGAYSDAISSRTPKYTDGKDELSENELKKTAEKYLGESVSFLYSSDGTLPVCGFSFGDGGIIEVSKHGGHIVTVSRKPDTRESSLISQSRASQIVLNECKKLGLSDMKCRRIKEEGGQYTAELTPYSEGVYLYPDTVKMTVSSDGKVIRLDCRDYLMNHYERTLSLPESAPDGASLALLSTDGQDEILCYEYFEDGVLSYMGIDNGLCRKFSRLSDNETFLPD